MQVPISLYRAYPPIAALSDHVLCVWLQVITAGQTVHHRVLPDGCADLVWIGEASAVVAGPATGPVLHPLAPGTEVIGVRLRPGAVAHVLGQPAHELSDRDTPLADVWDEKAAAPLARVTHATSMEAKLASAQAALLRRVADLEPPDRTLNAAIRWLARHPAGRIDDLARALEVGTRRLHRQFTAAVGYGPKTFQRVIRLQRLLTLAGRDPGRSGLAGLALSAGFADQAHMSREVRALAGVSPRVLLCSTSSTLELSDLFKTAATPDH